MKSFKLDNSKGNEVNGLAAVGGLMIIGAFASYLFIDYTLAYLLGIFGVIFLLAGLMTLDKK